MGEVTGDKAWAMRPCAQISGVLFDTVKSLNFPSLGILGFAWQKKWYPIIAHHFPSFVIIFPIEIYEKCMKI